MVKTLLVFVKYKYKKEIFTKGTILYRSKEVFQLVNDDGIDWDEVKLISYSEKGLYNYDLNEFNEVKNEIEKYKVIFVKFPSKIRGKLNKFWNYTLKNLIFSDDTSFSLPKKERPTQKRLRTAGSAPNFKTVLKMRTLFNGRSIYLVNLIKIHDIAHYPEGYEGKQVSGKKAIFKYARIAYKYNKKHNNIFMYSGIVKSTIADNTGTETNWNSMAIVKYDSPESWQKFISEDAFKAGIEHKDASIEATYVYACS